MESKELMHMTLFMGNAKHERVNSLFICTCQFGNISVNLLIITEHLIGLTEILFLRLMIYDLNLIAYQTINT